MSKNLTALKTEIANFDNHFMRIKKWTNVRDLDKLGELTEIQTTLKNVPKLEVDCYPPNIMQWNDYLNEIIIYLKENKIELSDVQMYTDREGINIKANIEETDTQYHKRITAYLLNLRKKVVENKSKEEENIKNFQIEFDPENVRNKKRLSESQEYISLAETILPKIEEKISEYSPVKQLNEVKMSKVFKAILNDELDQLRLMFIGNTYVLDELKKAEDQINSICKDIKIAVENFYNHNKNLSEKDFAKKVAQQRTGSGLTSLMLSLYVNERIKNSELLSKGEPLQSENNYKEFAIDVYKKLYSINDKDVLRTPLKKRLIK